MTNNLWDPPVHAARLGFPTEKERLEYENRKIQTNKMLTRIIAQARKNAKPDHCYLCKGKCSSFANSHTVPRFTLRSIANHGKLALPLQQEIPTLGKSIGIGNAGTFHLICSNCDNTRFQKYEDPVAYDKAPDNVMLAQIALKNYLRLISKRHEEYQLYELAKKRFDYGQDIAEDKQFWGEMDLREFERGASYAVNAIQKQSSGYYLCYHRTLDYVVPIATQAAIAVICDFDEQIINNIYNETPEYKIKYIHISVFPLKEKSVILLFIEDGEKRYRKFYKKLNALPVEDQLAAINYLIFSYTEDVFLHPDILSMVQSNSAFMDVCRKSTDVEAYSVIEDPLPAMVKEFSLSQRTTIPNLLSSEYALDLK